MRCVLCDRCKEIIKDLRKIKVVTSAKPLLVDPGVKRADRADNPATNDILWTKELCQDCYDELEAFMSNEADSGDSDDSDGENEITE